MADKLLKSLDFGTGDKYYPSTKWENVENKPTIPTKTSELENDSNFLTEHQDLSSYALKSAIPTKVSQLTNDSKYLTSVPSEYITETELTAKGYAQQSAVSNLSEEIGNLTLGQHSDGLIYLFRNGQPQGVGITASGDNGDVVGYVDSTNTIVLNGNLADGTYNIKYEMEDGSTIDIGELVLDTNVYYTVTNNLTNCVTSNRETSVIEGGSYSATISANSGYELKSLSVTMGGSPVTVSNGVINITNVTGNIVITATAEIVTPENVLETVGYKTNTRIRASNGEEQTADGIEAVNFIKISYGQTISLQNIKADNSGNCSVAVYNGSKQYVSGVYLANFMRGVTANGSAINGELLSQKLDSTTFINNNTPISANSGIEYIRFSATEITNNSIVIVKN